MIEIGSGLDFTTTNVETTSPGLKVLGFFTISYIHPRTHAKSRTAGSLPLAKQVWILGLQA